MINNRYFIVNIPNANMSQIYALAVQDSLTIAKSNDGKKGIIKLFIGDEANHGILQNSIEYNHAEIIIEKQKPEWQPEKMPGL